MVPDSYSIFLFVECSCCIYKEEQEEEQKQEKKGENVRKRKRKNIMETDLSDIHKKKMEKKCITKGIVNVEEKKKIRRENAIQIHTFCGDISNRHCPLNYPNNCYATLYSPLSLFDHKSLDLNGDVNRK